ncbi:unnamed protein product [Rhodiola kirilowii]
MEALPSNDFLNFLIYDTIFSTPDIFRHVACSSSSDTTSLACIGHMNAGLKLPPEETYNNDVAVAGGREGKILNLGVVQGTAGGKKRRRKRSAARVVCKNKEEAETQRITHIVVERNRRKQMNEHLCVLRSLMPQSYSQRGDQASILGGAIEFVKELEHIVQSLGAQKSQLMSQEADDAFHRRVLMSDGLTMKPSPSTPFSQFFTCPQYTWSQSHDKCTASSSKAAIADIEVTLVEKHANIRILTKRSPKQPFKIVAGFRATHLTILHLNISTAMDSLVFYSISAKVEEGCPLISIDDIAGAVHQMLILIDQQEEDAAASWPVS